MTSMKFPNRGPLSWREREDIAKETRTVSPEIRAARQRLLEEGEAHRREIERQDAFERDRPMREALSMFDKFNTDDLRKFAEIFGSINTDWLRKEIGRRLDERQVAAQA